MLSSLFRVGATHNQRQSAATLGVDQEQSWNSGDYLNGAVSKRGVQSLDRRVTDILKDGRTVEGDNCEIVRSLLSCTIFMIYPM